MLKLGRGVSVPVFKRSFASIVIVIISAAPSSLLACSTIMISHDRTCLVGHNLDQEFYTPGMIHVNLRGESKSSVSGYDLGVTETSTPILNWVSRYGSVSFSPLGRGLPDGGINEAGLTVNEMALGESQFPFSDSLPTILAHQWIQYQLDMFANVEELIDGLPKINVQPVSTFTPVSWANYHAFVADRSGDFAIIEFLDSSIVVHRGDDAPVPVLCNSPYKQELKRLKSYEGFFGDIKKWFHSNRDIRFVIAAEALGEYCTEQYEDGVDFCFEILTGMQYKSTKQWSIVYDLNNSTVHFRTVGHPATKSLSLADVDFSEESRALILPDIDLSLGGDISSRLVPYSLEADRAVTTRFMTSLVDFIVKSNHASGADDYLLEHHGFTLEQFIDRAVALGQKTMK